MCKFKSHLLVALLTFGIGVLIASLWIIKLKSPTESVNEYPVELLETNVSSIQTSVETQPTNKTSVFTTTPVSSRTLCNRLVRLKEMPYHPEDGLIGDPVYNGLMQKGREAVPCLIEKITDTTRMKDPRTAPKVPNFRVGDTAVFMLLFITRENWQPETMLSPEYAKYWETEGVYSYFAFVEKPQNRKKIQQWWKDWKKLTETANKN
jgi:hypothetical protein